MNRRVFLRSIMTYAGIYALPLSTGSAFWADILFAQSKAPSAPGFGGFNNDKKRISENEFVDRVDELTNKWNENAAEYVIELSPEQKEKQREEVEKAMRNMVESKGYEISAPMNLRIIN